MRPKPQVEENNVVEQEPILPTPAPRVTSNRDLILSERRNRNKSRGKQTAANKQTDNSRQTTGSVQTAQINSRPTPVRGRQRQVGQKQRPAGRQNDKESSLTNLLAIAGDSDLQTDNFRQGQQLQTNNLAPQQTNSFAQQQTNTFSQQQQQQTSGVSSNGSGQFAPVSQQQTPAVPAFQGQQPTDTASAAGAFGPTRFNFDKTLQEFGFNPKLLSSTNFRNDNPVPKQQPDIGVAQVPAPQKQPEQVK